MGYNIKKTLSIRIKHIKLRGKSHDLTVRIYNDEKAPFKSRFKLPLAGLHEILFGEVAIGLYKMRGRKNAKLRGVIKLKLKQFLEDGFPRKLKAEVARPSYLNKADFYDPDFASIGSAVLEFEVCEDQADPASESPPQENKSILNLFFVEERAQMYKIVYDLIRATQRGTLLCRIHWIFGLISAEYYYNYIYGECKDTRCTTCKMQFCKNSYGELPEAELEEALVFLQYAAASFANSIMTWRLERRRNITSISDNRRKAIFERLDIAEEDLVMDVMGDYASLSFLAFFEAGGRMVLSFKGTTSGAEAIHDLNCDYTLFQDGYVHRGIKRLAERFLENHWDGLRAEMAQRGSGRLLLTGHSLGAAASVMVYLMMRGMGLESTFDIQVVGFGAPPIVSRSIAEKSFPRIRIYNYGTDIITRLNYGAVLDLKYMCISISSLYNYFTDKNLIVEKIAEIKEHLTRTELYTKLYQIGELYHIRDFGKGDGEDFLYKKVDYSFFEDIICARKAPFDHLLHKTMSAFQYSLKKKHEEKERPAG